MHRTAARPVRIVRTAAAVSVLVVALVGCASESTARPQASGTPSSSSTATTTPADAGTVTPSTTPSTTTEPTRTGTGTAEPTAVATQPASPASALAQHVFDTCRQGAEDAGVTLQYTDDPQGSSSPSGWSVVYPFRFDDGHDDPYAIFTCTLTDDTVHSTYVGSGLGDTH